MLGGGGGGRAVPTGAAVLAGAWLGAREEPAVARGKVWVPHGPAVP